MEAFMADIKLNFDMAEDITTKLIYLERRLAGAVRKDPISPYDVPRDLNEDSPQMYANALCDMLNIPKLLVTKATLPNGVMGLYTRQGNFCKIEVAPDAMRDRNVLLAVLSHELTHHFLFTHDVVANDRNENEILTDIATCFVGLGKFAVNGCFTTIEAYNRILTMETGYIKQDCFVYAYFLVCKVRGVDEAEQLLGLNSRAIDELYFVHSTPFYQKMVLPYLNESSANERRSKIVSNLNKLELRIKRLEEDSKKLGKYASAKKTIDSLAYHFYNNRAKFLHGYDARTSDNTLNRLLKIQSASHALNYIKKADIYISNFRKKIGV